MRRLVDTHIPRFRQTWQERTLRAPPSPHACTGVRTVCALTRSPKCARPRIRASHSSSVSAHGCSACNLRCPAGNRQRNRLPEASREVRRLAANLQQASVHFISALFTTFAALHCHTTLQCYAHHFVHVGSAVCIISLAVWLCGDYVRARSLCASVPRRSAVRRRFLMSASELGDPLISFFNHGLARVPMHAQATIVRPSICFNGTPPRPNGAVVECALGEAGIGSGAAIHVTIDGLEAAGPLFAARTYAPGTHTHTHARTRARCCEDVK
jgi:hypothetical protein